MGSSRIATILVWTLSLLTASGAVASEEPKLTDNEVGFVWTLLDRNARASADAGFLLYVLRWQGSDMLKNGWSRFGAGRQWLDWWLVLRPMPRRALHSEDYFMFQHLTERSEMSAVGARPEILDRIVRARIFHLGVSRRLKHADEPISIRHMQDAWLWWDENADLENLSDREMSSVYGYRDLDDGRFHYHPIWVNRLRWCYWLFGRRSEVTKVTQLTWKQDYFVFRNWLTENEKYMRFHAPEFFFKVDEDAKRQGQSVPQVARLIAVPPAPFDDWKGDTPEVYDPDFAGPPWHIAGDTRAAKGNR